MEEEYEDDDLDYNPNPPIEPREPKKIEHNFQENDLVIPSGLMEEAFYFRPNRHVLYDDVEYVLATPNQVTYYKKFIEGNMVQQLNVNSYISKGEKRASAYTKARNSELEFYKKQAENGGKFKSNQ